MGLVSRNDKWRITDALWTQIEPLLPPRKKHRYGGHNPRVSDRAAMNGILYVLRTGCQWDALDATDLCKHSSAHRRFTEWTRAGVFQKLWQTGLLKYDSVKGIHWRWLSMDGAMTKAPLGGKKKRRQPDGSGKTRKQTKHSGRRGRYSAIRPGGWRQSP